MYCKDNNSIYENKVRPEIQFLAERYNKIPDEDLSVPKLKTYYIDIEVHSGVLDKDKKIKIRRKK